MSLLSRTKLACKIASSKRLLPASYGVCRVNYTHHITCQVEASRTISQRHPLPEFSTPVWHPPHQSGLSKHHIPDHEAPSNGVSSARRSSKSRWRSWCSIAKLRSEEWRVGATCTFHHCWQRRDVICPCHAHLAARSRGGPTSSRLKSPCHH